MSVENIGAYRAASEALHRDHAAVAAPERASHYRMLWQCGLAELIRDDFYGLLELRLDATGAVLDAGCGSGLDALALGRRAPGLTVRGVDVGVALAAAAANSSAAARFTRPRWSGCRSAMPPSTGSVRMR